MSDYLELIKSCCKDTESFEKLKQAFESLQKDKESVSNHLNLLERAIKSDYDSILITTLSLEKPGPEIVYVNDGFTRMTGFTRDEVIGKTPRILQGPKTDRAVLDKLKERLENGQAFFGHTVNYRKDGSEFINQWDIHPLTNDQGDITHWVSYQHDITERKRSEKKLIDTRLEFDDLIEESKKTLIDVDAQGNIVTSNRAFRDLTGFDDHELKTKKLWDIAGDSHIEILKHKFDDFKPSDFDDQSFDFFLKNSRGMPIEVHAKARLLNHDGQTIVRMSFENKSLQKRILNILSARKEQADSEIDTTKEFRYKLIKQKNGSFSFKSVSESFSKLTGIAVSETAGVSLNDIIHEDDLNRVVKHFNYVFEGRPNTEQFRIKGLDNKYIKVIDYAKPVWDEDRTSVIAIKGATSTYISSAMSN